MVSALIESKNVKDYINKMRLRDPELSQGYGQFVHILDIQTKGGNQKMNCANLSGIFRIIQSIPSPKTEPFKLWLAKVEQERIEEIQNPERAMIRAKHIYDQKGYSENWVAKRMRGINKVDEYARLTNVIHQEWSGLNVKNHENLKLKILYAPRLYQPYNG